MAWKQVKVKVGSVVHNALQNDNELHISSDVSISDDVNIDGKKVSRSYSMSSAPNLDNTVAVTVKREQERQG